jgi:hypothetical protein
LLSVAQPPCLQVANLAPDSRAPAGVVGEVSATHPTRRWQSVVVHRTAETQPRFRFLSGVADPVAERDCHFLVRPDGTVLASTAWRDQRPTGPDPFGLHIGLVEGPVRNAVSRSQLNALRELLDHLQQRFRLDPTRITLMEESDTSCRPAPPGGFFGIRNFLPGSRRPR